jgi:hypothetical protein
LTGKNSEIMWKPGWRWERSKKLTPWSWWLPCYTSSLHFMEPKVSLPHSEESIVCPCPKPDESSCILPLGLLNVHFNTILWFTSRSSH